MALQDLTPQLRTRLGRLERVVGVFITVATLLTLCGLGYYIYTMAERKGWFLKKMPYYTFVRDAAGLKVGDPVKLMGFDVGEITEINAQPPSDPFNVYVHFRVKEPFYGYLWDDSRAKVVTANLLGQRYIEVTKGTNGHATYREENGTITGVWDDKAGSYTPFSKADKGYWLHAEESPALTERAEKVISLVEQAIPNVLDLTNQLARVLANLSSAAAHADDVVLSTGPLLTNLTLISEHLRDPDGSLGQWLIPPNLNAQLTQTLASANTALDSAHTAVTNTDQRLTVLTTNTDAHLALLASNLNLSLQNLANITGNLHKQVRANPNLVTAIDQAIIHSDEFIQGLKRHWFLRSAFKEKAAPAPPKKDLRAPKWSGQP
jgi:hypothetical protein